MRQRHRINAAGRMFWAPAAAIAVVLVGQGCTVRVEAPQREDVRLEPVSYTGDNPFTPPMGTDQSGVTPPAQAGGTFAGDTVGLYGGSANESVCDQVKLVEFLQQNPDKAAAWAGVLGIAPADIPAFVMGLTPVILRSDTQVTNHGFENGTAVAIPAVLQAGTAVLVDKHGFPVTKCFCGNPLTAPTVNTPATFVGPQWSTFVPTSVTVIVPVTQVVNQFTLVEPGTSDSFQRPAGTAGAQDGPVTQAPPAPPTSAPAPPPTSSQPPPLTPPPTTSPPPGTQPPATQPPPAPSPTQTPAPTQPQPQPQQQLPRPALTTEAPPATVSPSPSAVPSQASWVLGDCYVARGQAHAVLLVASRDRVAHTFTVSVRIGPEVNPYSVQTVRVPTTPGQIAREEITAPVAAPDAVAQCAVTSIVDENGLVPIAGDPITPPPDTRPTPPPPSGPPVAPNQPAVPSAPSGPGGPGDLEDSVPPGVVPAPS